MANLTSRQVVREAAEKAGIEPQQAELACEHFIAEIMEHLLRGNQIDFENFATLKIAEEKARIVKDPRTGHRTIVPARNVIVCTPAEEFEKQVEHARLASILLIVPKDDDFAQTVQFHFSRVGWRVQMLLSVEQAMESIEREGAYLVIADGAFADAGALCERVKITRQTNNVPVILLYPRDRNTERPTSFEIIPDQYLVEPFEVFGLLTMAEGELARSSEEEVLFQQQVTMRFPTVDEFVVKANEIGAELFKQSGLDEEGQIALAAAFRESVGNATQHGNKYNPDKQIEIQYFLDNEKITIIVKDEGEGFECGNYVDRARDRDAVGAARERQHEGLAGGLGLMLMMKCTDHLEYNDRGNTIRLTKRLPLPED